MSESIDLGNNLSQSRRIRSSVDAGSSSMTSSRPFLNLLNPLGGRAYRGYEQAPDDIVEEQDEDEERDDYEDDKGEGTSTRPGWMQASAVGNARRSSSGGNPHSSGAGWLQSGHEPSSGAGYHDDEEDEDEDDGEVPQSLMIEARRPRTSSRDNQASKVKSPPRTQHSHRNISRGFMGGGGIKNPINMPPRPSDLQSASDFALPLPTTAPSPVAKQGLDEYERALWSWVNVYNLDAFLQEVSGRPCDAIRQLRLSTELQHAYW